MDETSFKKIFADLEREECALEMSACRIEDGRKIIKDPAIFEKIIRLRNQRLAAHAKLLPEIREIDRARAFRKAVLDGVGEIAPACKERIENRLARDNDLH